MIETFLDESNCIINSIITRPVVPPIPDTPNLTPPIKEYIIFEDAEVKRICVENWGSDGELTYEQAAAVTDLNGVFDYWANNLPPIQITSFNELQYFTGLLNLGETPDGNGQFSGAEQLKEITLPPSVTSLEDGCFDHCSDLTSVIIPPSVTYIGMDCFTNCTNLTSVTIPTSVTEIGGRCFSFCINLSSLTMLSPTPPTLGNGALDATKVELKITVPAESVDAYKVATGWSSYSDKITAINQ